MLQFFWRNPQISDVKQYKLNLKWPPSFIWNSDIVYFYLLSSEYPLQPSQLLKNDVQWRDDEHWQFHSFSERLKYSINYGVKNGFSGILIMSTKLWPWMATVNSPWIWRLFLKVCSDFFQFIAMISYNSPISGRTVTQVRVWDSATKQWTVIHPLRTAYYSFISAVLFFLPIVTMTVAYVLIIWKLWSSKRPGEALGPELKMYDNIKKRVNIALSYF